MTLYCGWLVVLGCLCISSWFLWIFLIYAAELFVILSYHQYSQPKITTAFAFNIHWSHLVFWHPLEALFSLIQVIVVEVSLIYACTPSTVTSLTSLTSYSPHRSAQSWWSLTVWVLQASTLLKFWFSDLSLHLLVNSETCVTVSVSNFPVVRGPHFI